jgi:hypothetical protein
MQHPRMFGRGHIGRGRTNIAPIELYVADHDDNTETKMNKDLPAALQFRRLINFHAYIAKVSGPQQVPQMVNPQICGPT